MKKLLIILCLMSFGLMAQDETNHYCGTYEVFEDALQDPEKKQILDQLEVFTQNFIANKNTQRSAGGSYIVPVVVHVLHDYEEENISYDQIQNGIARINQDINGLNDDISETIGTFSSIIGSLNIEFRLATIDPDGNCTFGVTRTATDLTMLGGNMSDLIELISWDDYSYVNIWVVKNMGDASSAAAYATKPGMGGASDGIVCLYTYFGDWNTWNDSGPTGANWQRHTLGHEMGHFFNLDHPWGPTNDPGEVGNCILDDNVQDTPNTIGSSSTCNLSQETCGSLDNVQNHMDYASCSHMFTQGQADRMEAALNSTAGGRVFLFQESNLIATGTNDAHFLNSPHAACSPIPDFKTDDDIILCGNSNTVQFQDFTYNYGSSITYSWSFPGGLPSSSSQVNPTVTYNQPGSYDVTLIVCNGNNCNTLVKEDYIVMLTPEVLDLQAGLVESFEDVSFPNMQDVPWFIGQDYNEQHWERTESAYSDGVSSLRISSENYGTNRYLHQLVTPQLDLSNFAASNTDPLKFCFDFAYARKSEDDLYSLSIADYVSGSIHNDALLISYKTSCGSSWIERPRLSTRPGEEGPYLSQQESLFSTNQIYPNGFLPTNTQWKQYCITINQLSGSSEAVIKFEFVGTGGVSEQYYYVNVGGGCVLTSDEVSIGGNWLYIDNIQIGYSSVVEEQVVGCSDSNACNYNSDLDVVDNGTCIYADFGYDCAGLCIIDVDCDGVCDQFDNCPWVANADQADYDNDQLGDLCDPSPLTIDETLKNKSVIKTIDILGRETAKQGLYLEFYDDGSVEKKYLLK